MEPKKSSGKLIDDGFTDPMKQLPQTKYQKHMLKSVIGETRANQVLTSMSMSIIPKVGDSIGKGLDSKLCFILNSIVFYRSPSI